jgi:hypothetical protein
MFLNMLTVSFLLGLYSFAILTETLRLSTILILIITINGVICIVIIIIIEGFCSRTFYINLLDQRSNKLFLVRSNQCKM